MAIKHVDRLIGRAELARSRAAFIPQDRELRNTWRFIAECYEHLARLAEVNRAARAFFSQPFGEEGSGAGGARNGFGS